MSNPAIPPQSATPRPGGGAISLGHRTIQGIIWTVVFGTALAVGGSALEPFLLPVLGITAASFWVVFLVTLNKLVMRRRLSVTGMYAIASTIAIFTTYLGPPSVLKPLFILAGLAFDLATRLRTKNITFLDIAFGHAALTVSGFFFFWLIFKITVPGSSEAIATAVKAAAPIYYICAVPVAYFTWRFARQSRMVARIQSLLE